MTPHQEVVIPFDRLNQLTLHLRGSRNNQALEDSDRNLIKRLLKASTKISVDPENAERHMKDLVPLLNDLDDTLTGAGKEITDAGNQQDRSAAHDRMEALRRIGAYTVEVVNILQDQFPEPEEQEAEDAGDEDQSTGSSGDSVGKDSEAG